MRLTDFGRAVRKARLDAHETLSTMAESLEVSPAFLSAMETGRKKIPEEWVKKTTQFFEERGVMVKDLGVYADMANKSVSLEGCDPQQQMLIAGFARSSFDAETLAKLADLLGAKKEED
ncbi:helix-turn-helix transcriptional regulator [Candidatus Methylospira mobilis]|uniref:Helix-turn-helix transcriptional regulator n=1 Tax=Candidatus Methylospira mobilis TaxID=1808979 RepID=A0A5Q0BLN1_9GAMM|nr:helix-turn-helix transcriptional regulator [Candidatus Methylospira mobilis]QFY43007.1 helix-turn-helix transcriptional regulator [Candidatus Methylospira mobilis]